MPRIDMTVWSSKEGGISFGVGIYVTRGGADREQLAEVESRGKVIRSLVTYWRGNPGLRYLGSRKLPGLGDKSLLRIYMSVSR